VRVKAELVRLPGGSMSAPAAAPGGGFGLSPGSNPWTSEVNLTSVRTPVVSVRLKRTDGTGTSVYQCPASSGAGCIVELNGPALQDLLGSSPRPVSVGTYNQVNIIYCAGSETGYRTEVTGTTVIGGTTYSTRAAGTLSATGPAEPVAINYHGCGADYPISPPLVIEDSTTATTVLRLYFDIRNIASAALGSPGTNNLWVSGACTPVSPLGSAPFLCVGYTEVIAVVGTTPPLIERYRVNNGGTIGLVFDAGSDLYFGGYLRRYVVEDQTWNPGFTPDGGISSFTRNGDGTYRLQQHASISGQPGALFAAWQRATHSGTITYEGRSNPYTAVRLP
jgi:hypothetical protein